MQTFFCEKQWGSKLDIKKIITSKKFKNIAITVIEILVVAGIIFGGLMLIQNKVTKEADKTAGNSGKGVKQSEKKENEKSDRYYIEVNKRLNAVIVYQYSKDKKSKEPIKVLRCCLGENLPKGKFKTGKKYLWLDIYQGWHKYNTGLGRGVWIHSSIYREKYDYCLSKASYKSLGNAAAYGKSILLSAKDAAWVYSHCKEGTEVVIVKGKKQGVLPMSPDSFVSLYKYCGWDPTDPDKNNPYKKIKNGSVVKGLNTITVERGHKPDYLGNIIALNQKGKVITGKLKYNTIDYSKVGTYQIKYRYKAKNGTKYKITQKIKIVDTTPPKVSCSKSLFTLEVKSAHPNDINIEKNVKAIVDMVKSSVTTDESVVDTEVYTIEKEQLRIDEKAVVVVKAKDPYGNIGSCQVMCELKVKEETTKSKEEKTKPAAKKPAKTVKKKTLKKKAAKKKTSKKKTEKNKN